jgi:hypothetical protein
MVRSIVLLVMSLVSLGMGGCVGTGTRDIFHPGDEKTQVARSQYFDPYPEPDLGPPIVGGRPPDYESPRDEVVRARWYDQVLSRRQDPTPNGGCPPGFAPNYAPAYAPGAAQGVYSQSASGVAPQAYNNVPGLAAPPDQPGNVIYVPPPAVAQ